MACYYSQIVKITGGEGGIRTHGTRKGSTVFETARFNHSRTSPYRERGRDSQCTAPSARRRVFAIVSFVCFRYPCYRRTIAKGLPLLPSDISAIRVRGV